MTSLKTFKKKREEIRTSHDLYRFKGHILMT